MKTLDQIKNEKFEKINLLGQQELKGGCSCMNDRDPDWWEIRFGYAFEGQANGEQGRGTCDGGGGKSVPIGINDDTEDEDPMTLH